MKPVLSAVVALVAALGVVAPAQAASIPKLCQYLDGKDRLLPFPNNAFAPPSKFTETGRQLNIARTCAPANKGGKRIDTTHINRLDGFSPGSQLLLRIPGISTPAAFKKAKIAPVTDIGASLAAGSPIVILDARNRKRVAHWGELDMLAPAAKRLIMVHPAKSLTYGRRYVAVVRGIGKPLSARNARNKKVKALLAIARKAKIKSSGIHQIWDFTIGSQESIQARLLKIRDDAFSQLGDNNLADDLVEGTAPAFEVTGVEEYTVEQNAQLLRRVTGTYTVPCYLNSAGCAPGGSFNLQANTELPVQTPGNVHRAPFVCLIPRAAAAAPGRGSLYGHGLLGDADEATKGTHVHAMAQEHNFTFCATDWAGMSSADIPNTVKILNDLSSFNQLTDRLQQGIVAFTYLGRLMRHPQGLSTHPVFQVNGHEAFEAAALYYDGNSQGGIIGSTLTAIAPDFTRAVLGVPGMNFSLLLTRSSNWKLYGGIFNPAYPDQGSRPLALSLIQLLWDRSEPDGWAANMTNEPPDNTPAHTVLMQVARGDHQVAPVAADIQARTVGARTNDTPLAPGVSDDKVPLYGIATITSYPYAGSAIFYWEPGGGLARVPKQPLTNVFTHTGVDPHGDPRYTVAARAQKAAFLQRGGAVIDTCGDSFCQAEKDPARP